MVKKTTIICCGLMMCGLLLSGCGIKPKNLEPPSEGSERPYPATYPAEETL